MHDDPSERPNPAEHLPGATHFFCDDDRHDLCVHIPMRFALALDSSDEQAADLAGVAICACRCHLDCPMLVGEQWTDACTCNGTLLRRRQAATRDARRDGTRAADRKTRRAGRPAATKEVVTALKRPGADRSRVATARLVGDTWESHGLGRPVEPVLSMIVDRCLDPSRQRRAEEGLRVTLAVGLLPVRLWRKRAEMFSEGDTEGPTTFHIATGKATVPVVLDLASTHQLATLKGKPGPLATLTDAVGLTAVDVELRVAPDSGGDGLIVHAPDGPSSDTSPRRRAALTNPLSPRPSEWAKP